MESHHKKMTLSLVKNQNRVPIDVFSLILEHCINASAYNTWARLCFISAKAARKVKNKHIYKFLEKKQTNFYPFYDDPYYDDDNYYGKYKGSDFIQLDTTYYILPNEKKHGTEIIARETGHNQWFTIRNKWSDGVLVSRTCDSP